MTAKMIFAVNFGTCPLDHFLPVPVQGEGSRHVTGASATWASGDTNPVTSIEELRQTLFCLRDVATELYPDVVTDVFGAVHTDPLSRLLDVARESLVDAMVTLYTPVFTTLFQWIS